MSEQKGQQKTNPVWNFFKSVKLTFVLLLFLAISSIWGTFIPQGQDAMRFALKLGPTLFKIFSALELFDLYHSMWFRILIALLSVNLIVCSLDRLPRTIKLIKKRPSPDRIRIFEKIPEDRVIVADVNLEKATKISHEVLNEKVSSVEKKETPQGVFLYGERGRYSNFGIYLVHLSVLIILLGAIVGSIWGFEAFVNIAEGQKVDSIYLRNNGIARNLGFSIECNKFEVEFYKDGTPKEYRSHLSFIKKGRVVKKGVLRVNHPIQFQGITFYQASYGSIPGKSATVKITKDNQEGGERLNLMKGKIIQLPGSDARIELLDIRDDFMKLGPAVLIRITIGDERHRIWLFKHEKKIREHIPGLFERFKTLNPSSFRPYRFRLEDFETRYFTGLQANRDPGVPLVWSGFVLIILGCIVTFFTSHFRIWVRISNNGKESLIKVAGTCNRNPVTLERELDRISERIKHRLQNQ
jgi:cytochrome c biogenesis protein